MYKALIRFVDIDTGITYEAEDTVPVKGKSKERIQQMMSKNNVACTPLIYKVEEKEQK